MKQCLTFLLVLFSYVVVAQQPYFQNLETVNGLASNRVYSVFQDSDNYFWFGTDAGVSRFDGYTFINYDHQRKFLANEVFEIFEDSQRRIWFLSQNGEVSYYKDGVLYTSENTPQFQNLNITSQLTSIWEAINGDIYISTQFDGVFKFGKELEVEPISIDGSIQKVWGTRDGSIMGLGQFGIYDLLSKGIDTLASFDFSGHYSRCTVFRDTLWIANGDEVFSFYTGLKKEFDLPEGLESTFISFHDNKLVIGTRTGSYLDFRPGENVQKPSLFSESIVSKVWYDNENNLWITTVGDGVYLSTSPEIDIFTTKSGLALNQVTSLLVEDSATLWLGYRDGRYGILKNEVFVNDFNKTPTNEPVTKIVSQEDGSHWVLSKTYLTRVAEDGSKSFIRILGNDLLFEKDSVYLASTRAYHFSLDDFESCLAKDRFKNPGVEFQLLDEHALSHRTKVICQNENGYTFLGSDRGLFTRRNGLVKNIGNATNGLDAYINDLVFDTKRGLIYVATRGQGLIVLKDEIVIKRFNISNNLSSNTCVSLDLDREGNLWIGTSLGLDKIEDIENDTTVQRFGAMIGLRPTTVFDVERIGEEVYMATNIGLMRCHVNKMMFQGPKPPDITGSYVNSRTITSLERLRTLMHHQNTIRFDYVGLSYKSLGNLTYEYNLKGYQDGWRRTKDRSVQFESLESGSYEFQIKTIDGSGVSSEIVTVPVIISPPYWSTIWFRLISIIVFGLLIYAIGLYRFRSLKSKLDLERDLSFKEIERLELEKAYLVAEQKAGVLQMNPHFVFNSLNTIKGYYGQGKLKEANGFIAKFSKLLRKILESNKPLIPLKKEADILSLYLELMRNRYDHVFSYRIINNVAENRSLMIPPMILQPLVENAVIHGIAPLNHGEITITFELTDSELICKVLDTGVGFATNLRNDHHSVALGNIEDRLLILSKQYDHQCKIKIVSPVYDNAEAPGTLIEINLPINEI